jgi:UDP-2-acetamido-2-deoxy-ribo-hexuluronate aminotransferase
VRLGINGRMDTIQAAVLLAKLEVYADECASRERVAATYRRLLAERCPQLAAPQLAPGNTSVYAQYTVRVPQREAVQTKLQAVGIPTAVHYPTPLHLQPVFASAEFPAGSMPHAERAAREVMSLPMHPYLTEGEIEAVVDGLAVAIGELKRA